ncbi:MAG: glycosyltransferase family 2 protein [Burkholderia sp.]|nr:glycosyltransferase family 2 protein [Burkholderia sp.]
MRAVDLIVPVHDEEREVGACLRALVRSARHPRLRDIEVRLAVVLDACSDRSGEIAEATLRDVSGTSLVECRMRSAGAARGVGAEALRRTLPGRALEEVWVATTDADTRVPPDWLVRHVAAAAAGADAVAGVVEVADWHEQPEHVRRVFERWYRASARASSHEHVHGANLGVRASALAAAGGMPALALAEDHALVDRLVAIDAQILRTAAVRVVTSARREGRARGGFSDLLRTLA